MGQQWGRRPAGEMGWDRGKGGYVGAVDVEVLELWGFAVGPVPQQRPEDQVEQDGLHPEPPRLTAEGDRQKCGAEDVGLVGWLVGWLVGCVVRVKTGKGRG